MNLYDYRRGCKKRASLGQPGDFFFSWLRPIDIQSANSYTGTLLV